MSVLLIILLWCWQWSTGVQLQGHLDANDRQEPPCRLNPGREGMHSNSNRHDIFLGSHVNVMEAEMYMIHLQVMTLDPECATVDTPILDALRTMQERKFLHLPVMDRGIY